MRQIKLLKTNNRIDWVSNSKKFSLNEKKELKEMNEEIIRLKLELDCKIRKRNDLRDKYKYELNI